MTAGLVLFYAAAWAVISIALAVAWAMFRAPARAAAARRHEDQAIALTRPMRCLCCEGAPVIYDYAAHTRLCHVPREVGPEDQATWGARR